MYLQPRLSCAVLYQIPPSIVELITPAASAHDTIATGAITTTEPSGATFALNLLNSLDGSFPLPHIPLRIPPMSADPSPSTDYKYWAFISYSHQDNLATRA